MKKISNLLPLLLILVFLKGLVTSLIVPLWEFPDEQVHFGQIVYYNEIGFTNFAGVDKDVTLELYEAQKALGTVRRGGINNYTYNPYFRPAYSDNFTGIYETRLKNLPDQARTDLSSLREVARYPAGFYLLSSLGYRAAYSGSIIDRLFATRMVSILISIGTAYVAYRLGKLVFRSEIGGLSTAIVISFHPMFSFLSAGVNNDNLLNFFSILLVFLTISIFEEGLSYAKAILIGLISGLGLLTKPLIFPLIIGVGIVLIYEAIITSRSYKQTIKYWSPLLIVGTISGGFIVLEPLINGRLPYLTNFKDISDKKDLTFWQFLPGRIDSYYRETFVWYWGIFKWLGVILPLNLIRLIKVALIISGLGLVKYVISKRPVIKKQSAFILALLSVIFVVLLTIWDYDQVRKNGVSHGLQGRYFFPTIASHMILLLTGFASLGTKKFVPWILKAVSFAMIGLQLYSLKIIAGSYYSTVSLRDFFIQLSQYKPYYFKYPWSVVLLCFYIVMLLLFSYYYLQYQSPSGSEVSTKKK